MPHRHDHHNTPRNLQPNRQESKGPSHYLKGDQIHPTLVKKGMTVRELVDEHYRGYNAGRLSEACEIFAKSMLKPENETTIALTLAGAMTPVGLGGEIISLMANGFVDTIVSTGANLYHDIHMALGMELHRGDFRVDDVDLQREGVIRIYDVVFEDNVLLDTDSWLRSIFLEWAGPREISTSQLHHYIGTKLLEKAPHPERSVVAQAARLNVPIYTSSPGDSSIGMNIARMEFEMGEKAFHINPNFDVNETAAIVLNAKKNGVIILGGGSPKNFYLQTQPQLWEVYGIKRGGHDYFIQVTGDTPSYGGLSGATPQEAVSWGKINPDELNQTVVVYTDSTLALPIMTAYAIDVAEPRKPKELFRQLTEMVAFLRKEAKM